MKELDAQSTLQVLEGRTRKLERRLRFATCGWLLTVGVVLVSAWTWQSKSETVDTLRARQIVIVDEKGTERMYLGSPVSDPMINGKRQKRLSPSTGFILNDSNGNERGGFGVMENGNVVLGLDAANREAVSLFAGSDYNGLIVGGNSAGSHERAGLVVNNKTGNVRFKLADAMSNERLMIDVIGDSPAKLLLLDPKKSTMVNLLERLQP